MMKKNKVIILGGLLFSFLVANGNEIKEIKLLEDITKEIIGDSTSKNKTTTPKNISKEAETEKVKIEKIEDNVSTKSNSIVVENSNKNFDVNSIVDIYEKTTKDGIAYKKGENERFNGFFGAVIDGNIDYVESYKDGLLDGESAWFSRKGIKLLSENYSKGKLHGNQSSYYEDGKLKSIVKYVNGRVDGITSYDKNGKILHESIFKNGTGTWKFYWSNGKISEEGSYVSWKKNGVWKKYREDGTLDMTSTYDNGRLLSERWN